MNSPLPRITSRTAFLALVFTIAPIAVAQLAPVAPVAPTASTAPKADAETVTLSPFTVSTDKDVGFVATSSLAGGRLAGNLAGVAVLAGHHEFGALLTDLLDDAVVTAPSSLLV